MGNHKIKTAPCIINEGTLINKRDMIRALETLECVDYKDFIDNKIMSEGEGIVLKILACPESSTIIINGSIFLNVFSFDHLTFYRNNSGETVIELVAASRSLQIIPREEDPKLISKIGQGSYDYESDICESSDVCAHLIDESDIDDDI